MCVSVHVGVGGMVRVFVYVCVCVHVCVGGMVRMFWVRAFVGVGGMGKVLCVGVYCFRRG